MRCSQNLRRPFSVPSRRLCFLSKVAWFRYAYEPRIGGNIPQIKPKRFLEALDFFSSAALFRSPEKSRYTLG